MMVDILGPASTGQILARLRIPSPCNLAPFGHDTETARPGVRGLGDRPVKIAITGAELIASGTSA